MHHTILHRALKKAVKDRLLAVNPATDLERRRPSTDPTHGAREHCWSATEARRFIDTAKTASPQMAAFCLLALDTGARKSEQAELRMRNRTTYRDFGLIFGKEPEDLQTPQAKLGQPLCTLSEARFVRLITAAGIGRIKFYGLRHTCATLLLQTGTPVQVFRNPHLTALRRRRNAGAIV